MKKLWVGIASTAAMLNVACAGVIVSNHCKPRMPTVNHQIVKTDIHMSLENVSIKVYASHHKYLYTVKKEYDNQSLFPYFFISNNFNSKQLKKALKSADEKIAGYQVFYVYDVKHDGKTTERHTKTPYVRLTEVHGRFVKAFPAKYTTYFTI